MAALDKISLLSILFSRKRRDRSLQRWYFTSIWGVCTLGFKTKTAGYLCYKLRSISEPLKCSWLSQLGGLKHRYFIQIWEKSEKKSESKWDQKERVYAINFVSRYMRQGCILFPKNWVFYKSLFGGVEFFMVRNGNFGPNLVVLSKKSQFFYKMDPVFYKIC